MKTLDEVITGMTELILSGKTADVKSTVRDALHYLKAYREDKDDLTALRAYWAEMHKDVRQKAEVTDESDC